MPNIAAADLVQSGILVMSAVLLGIASLNDVATRTIPDLAPFGLVLIGVAARLAEGDAAAALAASGTVLLFGAVCWRWGWLGGGDVKLLAAAAWLVSPLLVPRLVLLTAIAGGILACIYLTLGYVPRRAPRQVPVARARSLAIRIWRVERWRVSRRPTLPYGCAIAAATLVILSGR